MDIYNAVNKYQMSSRLLDLKEPFNTHINSSLAQRNFDVLKNLPKYVTADGHYIVCFDVKKYKAYYLCDDFSWSNIKSNAGVELEYEFNTSNYELFINNEKCIRADVEFNQYQFVVKRVLKK